MKSTVVVIVGVVVSSLPSRGAWIEIELQLHHLHINTSLPSRGAWIEISFVQAKYREK